MKSSVLRTAVKLLVLGVLCCTPLPLSAENNPHLQMPKSLDFEQCPRGGIAPVNYSKIVTLTNNSDEDLYLIHAWVEPDSSYTKYSNFGILGLIFYPYGVPQLSSPALVIEARKSRQFSVWFSSEDTRAVGDTGNVAFNWKLILRSRTSPEFPRRYVDLYFDTLSLHAIAVDSEKISASHLDYHEKRGCPTVYSKKLQTQYNLGFVSTLKEAVSLDSLSTSMVGSSKPQWIKPIDGNTNDEIKLPTVVPIGGWMVVGAYFSPLPFGENRIVITGHFTGLESKKHYIADAILNLRDTLLQEARFYTPSTFFQSDDGMQQMEKEKVYLSSCSSESMWADSIVVTSEWERDEVKVTSAVTTFPFLLDPSEEYRLDITYTPKTRGRQFGFIKAYFHTNDGRQIVRTLDFQTYFPDSVSSVGEIREDSHATPSLLITDPNLPLKLLGTYLDTPKLYDSYGNFIDLSTRLEQDYISLEGLSSGVYCFVFNSPAGMVSRKVLYVR